MGLEVHKIPINVPLSLRHEDGGVIVPRLLHLHLY